MLDNHLQQGNTKNFDPRRITWKRCVDMNDRALRNVVIGLGGRMDGVTRQSGFDITAASEVMAILALADSVDDMRQRFSRIVVGYTRDNQPVTAEQLEAAGSMSVMMRDALAPNLLQTLENTPVLVHGGPFGNIAHGNSSIMADLIGIRAGDFLLTEAGFGADMGAERFFNIKCRTSGQAPDAAVLVATVRALKAHSGRFKIVAGRPLPDDPAGVLTAIGEKHFKPLADYPEARAFWWPRFNSPRGPSRHEAQKIAGSHRVRSQLCRARPTGMPLTQTSRLRVARLPRRWHQHRLGPL